MRARPVSVLICLALTLGATACGSADVAGRTGDSPATTKGSGSGSGGSSDSGSGGDSGGSSDSGGTIPDLSKLGDCLSVASSYAGLALSALSGPEAASKAQSTVEDLKSKLPSELGPDLDTVAKGFGTVAEKGLIAGSEALNTPEFNEASKRIEAYLDKACSGGGSSN